MDIFERKLDRKNNSVKVGRMIHDKCYVEDESTCAFTVADMDFEIMPEVKKAITEYMETNTFGYTFPWPSYYESVINHFKEVHQFEITREQIMTFTGVLPMIESIIKAFTSENEGICIMSPVYTPFFRLIKNNSRKLVDCPLIYSNNKYLIDFDLLDQVTQPEECKILLLCSPHNPVGRVWTIEELKKIEKISLKNNLIVISDEIHCDIELFGNKHTILASLSQEMANITFTCTSPSKTFNLAGLNVANLIIKNPRLLGRLSDYIGKQSHNWVNALGLVGCEAAYRNREPWLSGLKKLIEGNYTLLKSELESTGKIKVMDLEGSYLVWCDFNEIYNDETGDNLKKHQIYINEGKDFGSEGFFRINIAAPTENVRILCNRIKRFVNS